MKKRKEAKRQIRIAVVSNAGGSGKTTVATHVAYAVSARGYKVTLIELDHNGSLAIFAGLPPASFENSLSTVLQKDFKGDYPLTPLWSDSVSGLNAIQGGESLEFAIANLYASNRRHYVLLDRLDDYPLDSDLIIMDTPASLEPMGLLALAASTHILAPIKPEWKDTGSLANLYNWYCAKVDELRLKPRPQIMGFVPCRVDLAGEGTHRDILGMDAKGNPRKDADLSDTLPTYIKSLGIPCFPIIRESSYYLRACGAGIPLHLYRPGIKFLSDFDPLCDRLVELMTE